MLETGLTSGIHFGDKGAANRKGQSLGSAARWARPQLGRWASIVDTSLTPWNRWLFIFHNQTDAPSDWFLMTRQLDKPGAAWNRAESAPGCRPDPIVFYWILHGNISAVYGIFRMWKVSFGETLVPLPSPSLPFCASAISRCCGRGPAGPRNAGETSPARAGIC